MIETELKEFIMIAINDLIPDIELEAYHQKEIKKIKLTDYKEKWLILFFYPSDFTFICPTELEELSQNYQKLQELNAEVLTVSTDSAFVHKAWHDHSPAIKNVKYPMLADPTGKLCRELGTYIENEGVSLRGTFIFDPDQRLRTIEIHDNDIGRSADELLRKLQAAKFVHEHGGQVCPANWHPGGKTLKPGVALVGKI